MEIIVKKTLKHNYTSELELKSLLIRIKNSRVNIGTEDLNEKINKYINIHTKVSDKKFTIPGKKPVLKSNLKKRIIELSEGTSIDEDSYERFGEIILLMIEKILTKPQFSGYTYKDDFYSDAIYKILKYLHNFNHKLISERTGILVNAFAYISQIIHNSILFILNTKKKEANKLKKCVDMEHLNHNLQIVNYDWHAVRIDDIVQKKEITEVIELLVIEDTLIDEIKKLENAIEDAIEISIIYPANYKITFEEYNKLKSYLKGKVSITKKRKIKIS